MIRIALYLNLLAFLGCSPPVVESPADAPARKFCYESIRVEAKLMAEKYPQEHIDRFVRLATEECDRL